MKTKSLLNIAVICIILVLVSSNLFAQLQSDSKFGFKINIPSNWSKSSSMDGTDKVFDYASPDQNAAIQLRAFMADARITVDLLAQVNEQNLLPAGTKKLSLSNYTSSNGIPGKQGLYSMNYNGNEVSMAVFYTVQNGKGYVLTAIIPTSMINQKGEEIKRITRSFVIDGFEQQSSSARTENASSRFSGLAGGTSSTNKATPFHIKNIKLSDKIDANKRAINPGNSFNPRTAEINAVIEFSGSTDSDFIVSWIYKNWDQTILSEKFNFTDKGGIGVVSITKPNNGWPTGSYSVKIEMGSKVIRELAFTVSEQSSMSRSNNNNNSSSNSRSEKNEVTISGNGRNGTYTFNKSGSYPIKWNETVVIRGLDNSGTNALELYLYNNKGTGTFSYGLSTKGKSTFTIGAVDGKGLDGSPDGSSTGSLTVTEYREGGMIKGHFTARVKGHNIKGSFSLALPTPKDFGGYDLK